MRGDGAAQAKDDALSHCAPTHNPRGSTSEPVSPCTWLHPDGGRAQRWRGHVPSQQWPRATSHPLSLFSSSAPSTPHPQGSSFAKGCGPSGHPTSTTFCSQTNCGRAPGGGGGGRRLQQAPCTHLACKWGWGLCHSCALLMCMNETSGGGGCDTQTRQPMPCWVKTKGPQSRKNGGSVIGQGRSHTCCPV